MFTIFLGIILVSILGLYLKYKDEQGKAENITKNFPTPPRMPVLGYSKLTEAVLPEATGKIPKNKKIKILIRLKD